MGQRSQIIVRYNDGNGNSGRVASHLPWNYGEYMTQRASQVITFLHRAFGDHYGHSHIEELAAGSLMRFYIDDLTSNVQGFAPYDDVSHHGAKDMDNNNGWFLLDVTTEEWSFGFIIGNEDGGDCETVVGIEDYLKANLRCRNLHDVVHDEVIPALDILIDAEKNGHLMSQNVAHDLMTSTGENTLFN